MASNSDYDYIPQGIDRVIKWMSGREINIYEYEEIIEREGKRLTKEERGFIQSRLRLKPEDWKNRPPPRTVISPLIPHPDREALGQLVREIWLDHCAVTGDVKPSHNLSWDQLDEASQEVDRKIGEKLWRVGYQAARHTHDVRIAPEGVQEVPRTLNIEAVAGQHTVGHIYAASPGQYTVVVTAKLPKVHPGTSEEVQAILERTTDSISDLFLRNLVAIKKDDLSRLVDLTGQAERLREAVKSYAYAMANGSSFACAETFDAMMRIADGDYDADAQINPVERRDFDEQLLRIAELVALDDPAEITNEPLTDAIIRQLQEYGRSPAFGMVLEQLRAVRRWSVWWPFAYPETGKQAPDGSIGSVADLYNRFWTWAEGFDMITEPALERILQLSHEEDGTYPAEIQGLFRQLLQKSLACLETAKGIGEALEGEWDDSMSMDAYTAWAQGYKELAPLIRAVIGKEGAHDGQGRAAGNGQAEARATGGRVKAQEGTNGSEAQRHQHPPKRSSKG